MKSLYESIFDDNDIVKNANEGIIRDFLREKYNITDNYEINGNIVNVYKQNVYIHDNDLTSLTNGLFEFGEVDGTFDCSSCVNLKSLKGAPKKCEAFYCVNCKKIKSLDGSPDIVNLTFGCSGTKIKDLTGAPKKVGMNFLCFRCSSLESLKGAPEYVGCDFDCSFCKKLKSLKGCPKFIGRNLLCTDNHTIYDVDDSLAGVTIIGHFYVD